MLQMDTMISFSGGQDSTYVLYKWLKENPNKIILVHHVNLYNMVENRVNEERSAVSNILNWFVKQGLSNFKYIESSFSYGSLTRISIKDIQIVAVFVGIILRTPGFNSIRNILLSWHKGEADRSDILRGQRVRKLLTGLDVPPERYDLHFPIADKTRKEMATDMPADLLRMCSCCRRPKDGKPCGYCKTCKELKESGIFYMVGS